MIQLVQRVRLIRPPQQPPYQPKAGFIAIINITAAGVVDRELLYIELGDLFPPHQQQQQQQEQEEERRRRRRRTTTRTNNSNIKNNIKNNSNNNNNNQQSTNNSSNKSNKNQQITTAGHPRNATEYVWSTCVDDAAEARKRQKPKAQ